jgi:N-6 DNA methylase
MSSNQSGEGDIRRKIIEADLVDCMVALPGQLFTPRKLKSGGRVWGRKPIGASRYRLGCKKVLFSLSTVANDAASNFS